MLAQTWLVNIYVTNENPSEAGINRVVYIAREKIEISAT